jgi:DNA polymerase-3 subunit delta'
MTELPALRTLSERLCPWLLPALEQLDAARAAGRLGHAWLLAGPRGVGKVNLALVLAERLLRGTSAGAPPALGPTAFAAAMQTRHAAADHHPDLHWIHPEEDKRSISIDQVRAIGEALSLKAHRGGAKVVLIEPADGMTPGAINALLKTLEEPAGDSYLLLVSHQAGGLPATIRSRCQRVTLGRPRNAALANWLELPDPARLGELQIATGGSPLAAAQWLLSDINSLFNSTLEDQLIQISRNGLDPQSAVEAWLELDHEQLLGWLLRRLHAALKARLAPNPSTVVTDPGADGLHNAWAALTLRTLFGQYQAAERLLSQLGAGINVELALRALLLGFQPDRGRP